MTNALPIYVLRDSLGDCTNHGISETYDRLLVACPDGHVKIDPNDVPDNFVRIIKREIFGTVIYHIEPATIINGEVVSRYSHYMFGGNFAHTSDSRFSHLIGGMYGAVAIHDRIE